MPTKLKIWSMNCEALWDLSRGVCRNPPQQKKNLSYSPSPPIQAEAAFKETT